MSERTESVVIGGNLLQHRHQTYYKYLYHLSNQISPLFTILCIILHLLL